MMSDVDKLYNRICGKLLGDGCITKQERRKPRFQFMHRTEDFGWTNYCYEQLKNFIPLSPPFKIRFLTDGQNRLILYDQFLIIYFLHLVSPWLDESMTRKWLPNQLIQPITKRTSIYLPIGYKQIKPTAEINEKLDSHNLLLDPVTKKDCPKNIFSTFRRQLTETEVTKGYQIAIAEHHRELLAIIRQTN